MRSLVARMLSVALKGGARSIPHSGNRAFLTQKSEPTRQTTPREILHSNFEEVRLDCPG